MATKFYLESRSNKHNEVLIRCCISIHGKRLQTTSGVSINPGAWNEKKQQVKATFAGRPFVNAKGMTAKIINARLKAIDTYFADVEIKTAKGSDFDLKEIFAKQFGKGDQATPKGVPTFFEIFDEFTATMGAQNNWTKGTFAVFATLKDQIKQLFPDATFSSFDMNGLTNFVEFLRNKLGQKNSTIGKKVKELRWFLRWAESKGYNTTHDYQTFAPKLKKTDNKVVFLTWDELMKVCTFDFPKLGQKLTLQDMNGKTYEKRVNCAPETLSKVRDIFCFCCFTSLRYSDVANLKRQNIYPGYIAVTTIKTADTLKIELNKHAAAILDKYKDTTFPHGKALPVISNQRMNEYLKEMAEICGLNEPITKTYYYGNERKDETRPKWAMIGTHTARRTFICNALSLGIAPQIVMKWTGHSDYKAMKPYIDIADQAKADAMKLFDK
ncbi:MAG: phage integrase SAM-like domain-containing protein [Alphaproteobacteria bacterium]|nr:phage integrase SAM-like domain-containing protein [Alphaproteobacteria bacterium]